MSCPSRKPPAKYVPKYRDDDTSLIIHLTMWMEIAQRVVCMCANDPVTHEFYTVMLRLAEEKIRLKFFFHHSSITGLPPFVFPLSSWTTNVKVVLESNFLINTYLSRTLFQKRHRIFDPDIQWTKQKKERVTITHWETASRSKTIRTLIYALAFDPRPKARA